MSPETHALDLLERVLSQPKRAAVSCSFQTGGVALVHLLLSRRPRLPVLFVDTGYHFPETLRFRDELAESWNLDLRILTAPRSAADHEAAHGTLHRTDPDRCCDIRKVEPLYRALEGFDLWLTGVRRLQSPTRALTREVERKLLPSGHVIEKVNPLVGWSVEDLESYHARHLLPRHPLYAQGYQSIGCAPCTIPAIGGDVRSGRWTGREKTECGLHTTAEDVA